MILAHAETAAPVSSGLLDSITHQPTWVVLVIGVFVLFAWFAVLNLFHVKFLSRLIALLPVLIALSVLFFSHNPIASTILLSGGFILAFGLALAMLQSDK